MRKIVQTLILFITALSLVACGQGQDSSSAEKTEEEPLRIALLVEEEGDFSFNDAAIRGFRKVKEDYDDAVYLRQFEFRDRIENAFLQAAEEDFDVIVGSSELEELVSKFATEYPQTKFWLYDSNFDFESGDYSNVYSIHYNSNEAAYIGGYLAASSSDTGTIGFLAGQDILNVRDFYVGYVQGARSANPDIKVVSALVGDWEDHAKGKELGKELYDKGSSVVFNVAGGSGVGLIEEAIEQERQVLGVDLDQAAIFAANGQSIYAERIPTSVLKNIGLSLHQAVEKELAGEIKYGQIEYVGLAEEGVGLADNAYFHDYFSGELIKKAQDLRKEIINGDIEVDSAFDLTDEEFQELVNTAS